MQPTRPTTTETDSAALAGAPADERTIPRLALAAAERFGEASALEDGEKRLSFRDFWREGLRAARAFCAAGVRPGDRIALWAPNLWEWPVAALGLHAAGGVLVPLNTRMKGGEAGYVLRKSGARILVTLRGFLGTDYPALLRSEALPDLERTLVLRGEPGEQTAWGAFLAEGAQVSEDEARARALAVSPDDLSDVLFTSGTTGKPKGVMTCHGQNLRAFAAWSEVVGLRAGDRYLCVNPFFHAFGYKSGWLASLMRGATLLPQAVFDAQAVLERIGRDRISMLPGPPTLYQTILAHPERARFDLSSLRLAVTGAAAIPVELVRRMRDELGFETVVTGYGLTEACGIATMCRAGDDAETIATTSGRAIPGVEVICADRDGKQVARGEPGEVLVRGYNVMRGYFDDEVATREAIDADGWLHTGDIGVMDERGNLRITDRIKDMFITGGFNCYPAEIEGMLYGSGLCAQVAVIGVPDERQGEVGMAFVVPAPGRATTPEAVVAWCREHMANYKVPRRVEIVDALPTNASGKVTKFSLRERARDAQSRS
jgi:acyl-CoA synthetase (AMP-forming)/AMP-acid ligase II